MRLFKDILEFKISSHSFLVFIADCKRTFSIISIYGTIFASCSVINIYNSTDLILNYNVHFIEKCYLCNAKVTFVCQWKNSNNLFFEMHMLMRNNCTNNWKIDSIDFSSSNVHKWRWFWQHRQFVVFRLSNILNVFIKTNLVVNVKFL